MTHIAEIRLDNWMCFEGVQVLKLGPRAYGISARREGDAESSNWAGKTALTEAVEFALSGWLNRDRGHGAAGWITAGQQSGGVRLVLSDGLEVHRHRLKTTQLHARFEGRDLKGDEAQALVDQRLGLSAEDRRATCFLRQREAARLVLADPAERLGVVEGWLRLERLQAARAAVQQRLRDASAECRATLQDVARAEEALAGELVLDGQPATVEELEAAEGKARALLEEAERDQAGLAERAELARRCAAARARVPEYRELVAAGRALAAEVKALDVGELEAAHARREAALREASDRAQEARREAALKAQLAGGKFDGRCPVAEMACPVAAEINARRKRNGQLAEQAKQRLENALDLLAAADAAEKSERAALQEARRKAERLEALREQQRRMLPEYERARAMPEPEDLAELAEKASRASARHREALQRSTALAAGLARARRAVEALEAARARAADDAPRLAALAEASALLGRARRQVGEGAVAEIEAEANAVLRDAGIDLGFRVSWAREGRDPARACEACGWAFPASARVKACAACGAKRGFHQVQRMEFELTNRSGAAEDLVGLSFQLAASRWLRADRGCAWASASLDEPLAQMDAANRRAFGARLGPMLAAAGFDQALVISHTSEVLYALPGRIEIVAGPEGSTATVVA